MDELLDLIVARIRKAADPDKIVLFGSRSKGKKLESDFDSDYDLLVLKKGIEHRRAIAQQIYRELVGVPASVDVIVETPEKAESYRQVPGFIYAEALKGKTIYER